MKKLYLANWSYNMALVFDEIEKIVLNNNGKLCGHIPYDYPCLIENRELSAFIRESKERIERYEALEREKRYEPRTNALIELKDKLAKAEQIPNGPIETSHSSYIGFVFDGYYYYFQVSDNPFFEHHFQKIKVNEDGSYVGEYYLEEVKRDWLFDCLFKWSCTAEERREIANLIFNSLVNGRCSQQVYHREKVKVPNTYNNSYHWEWKEWYDKKVRNVNIRKEHEAC